MIQSPGRGTKDKNAVMQGVHQMGVAVQGSDAPLALNAMSTRVDHGLSKSQEFLRLRREISEGIPQLLRQEYGLRGHS